MKEKLKQSAKSSNFWNNISTISSLIVFGGILAFVKDPQVMKDLILAYMSSSGIHNAGNVLAHINKD